MENIKLLKSGEFLVMKLNRKMFLFLRNSMRNRRMIAQTCSDFLEAEVYPNLEKVEKSDRELMKRHP